MKQLCIAAALAAGLGAAALAAQDVPGQFSASVELVEVYATVSGNSPAVKADTSCS